MFNLLVEGIEGIIDIFSEVFEDAGPWLKSITLTDVIAGVVGALIFLLFGILIA